MITRVVPVNGKNAGQLAAIFDFNYLDFVQSPQVNVPAHGGGNSLSITAYKLDFDLASIVSPSVFGSAKSFAMRFNFGNMIVPASNSNLFGDLYIVSDVGQMYQFGSEKTNGFNQADTACYLGDIITGTFPFVTGPSPVVAAYKVDDGVLLSNNYSLSGRLTFFNFDVLPSFIVTHPTSLV